MLKVSVLWTVAALIAGFVIGVWASVPQGSPAAENIDRCKLAGGTYVNGKNGPFCLGSHAIIEPTK